MNIKGFYMLVAVGALALGACQTTEPNPRVQRELTKDRSNIRVLRLQLVGIYNDRTDIENRMGTPSRKVDAENMARWRYPVDVYDPETGRTAEAIDVVFIGNRVQRIDFAG